MPSRSARFASALLAGFLAGTPVTMVSLSAARAANECLSGPKEQTPPGGHWYYRIQHPSNRQCWYLREEGENLSQGAAPNSSQSAKPASPKPAPPMQPSIADARAELPAPTWIGPANPGVVRAEAMPPDSAIKETGMAMPDAATQRSIVASRWPDQPNIDPSTNPAPSKRIQIAEVSPTTRPQPSNVAAGQLAAAAVETPTYSAPIQFAALIGALALAGILGSVMFKFVNSRRLRRARIRRRRGPIWESTDDDRIVLSGHPDADVLPRRTGFARDLDKARRDDRVAEFFAQLSKRTPT
jgi:hypothetical protein